MKIFRNKSRVFSLGFIQNDEIFDQVINTKCFQFTGFRVDGHTIEYIISVRGKIQLVIDGYPFYRYSIKKNKTTYNCVQNRILGFVFDGNFCDFPFEFESLLIFISRCDARARVIGNNEDIELVDVSHNHPAILPRRAMGEATRLKKLNKMKRLLASQK